MEIEFKLLVAAQDLARVFAAEPVKRRAASPACQAQLASVYYDTPEGDLRSHGIALRLRRENGLWVQTLKGGGSVAGGLHQREETEWLVPGQRLDLARLAQSSHAKLFAGRRVRQGLRPVFSTRFARTAQMLQFDDGSQVELCADRGAIRSGARRAPISEIEIEIKSGNPQRLFDLAQELVDVIPFRLGDRSKSERGYALYTGESARPRKALPVVLERRMPAIAALRRVAGACMGQVQANEEGFCASSDPEYLHQLRVGFRRLRVALSLPRESAWVEALAPLKEEMRWLSSVLGPARNWDVYITETLPPMARHVGAAAELAAFRARSRRLRGLRVETARAAVRSPRYTRLLLAIGALLAGEAGSAAAGVGLRSFAKAALRRHDSRVRRLGAGMAEASAVERHRARIQAKKLRYCAEFFASLHPRGKVKPYVAALSELQDVLGALNDARVGATMTAEVAQGWQRDDARVIGVVQGWIAANDARAQDSLGRAWEAFAGQDSYWDR